MATSIMASHATQLSTVAISFVPSQTTLSCPSQLSRSHKSGFLDPLRLNLAQLLAY